MMILFDNTQRTNYEPALYAEPDFTYLNRSARGEFEEVRNKLEIWFSHYPVTEQLEFRARFRSEIDSQHQSALFELLLHEILVKSGCSVTPHPTLSNTVKTPDFLVEPLAGKPFYIEAVLATNKSAKEVAAQARKNDVYDVINKKVDSSKFFLLVNVKDNPKLPPPANKIASFLNERLANLDPDDVANSYETDGMDASSYWKFEHEDWVIEFKPIPKKHKARNKAGGRSIGAETSGFHLMDDSTLIHDAIIKKAGRYGRLDLPYIVAVNVLGHIDEIDIMEALFGTEEFTINTSQNNSTGPVSTQMSRVPNGVWTSYEGPRYTRLSAVLLATRLSPWNLSSNNVCLYHNPWSQKPYSSILTRFPQAILEGTHMKKVDGEPTSSILDLSISWPMPAEMDA